MSKIELDKYYTSDELAKYCVNKAKEIIGEENITQYLEPSAGGGAFLNHLPNDTISYDIEPEDDRVLKKDYLELNLEYKQGRCIIGNPPYGRCLNLAQKFYKKSIELGDYICFILPISQLNNNKTMYEFDLIYSEDLGLKMYSERSMHCCFNIYRRNPKGLNKRKSFKLKDVKIIRQDSSKYNEAKYDIRICYWGNGSAGKVLSDSEHYSAEYKIQVLKEDLKDRVVAVLESVNWHERLNCISMLKIQQFHIYELLKEKIPELE